MKCLLVAIVVVALAAECSHAFIWDWIVPRVRVCLRSADESRLPTGCIYCDRSSFPTVMESCTDVPYLPENVTTDQGLCISRSCSQEGADSNPGGFFNFFGNRNTNQGGGNTLGNNNGGGFFGNGFFGRRKRDILEGIDNLQTVNDDEILPTGPQVNQNLPTEPQGDLSRPQTRQNVPTRPQRFPLPQNLPGFPSFQNLPGFPNLPNFPGFPNLQNLPGFPNLQNLTGFPNLQNFPGFPNLQNLPGFQNNRPAGQTTVPEWMQRLLPVVYMRVLPEKNAQKIPEVDNHPSEMPNDV